MAPQTALVSRFVQSRDAHPVLIRLFVLRQDIHGHLRQIQVGADARRGCDPGSLKDIRDDLGRKLPRIQPVDAQVAARIYQYLINRVDVDVFRSEVAQVHLVDAGRIVKVEGHARLGCQECQLCLRVAAHHTILEGREGELSIPALPLQLAQTVLVHLIHALDHFEEPRSATDAVRFERR